MVEAGRQMGDIETLLMQRYQQHVDRGNKLQEIHYLSLLFDLRARINLGLDDETSPGMNLPPIQIPEDLDLAIRYKRIFGPLEDYVDIEGATAHFLTNKTTFTHPERALVSLGFNRALTAIKMRGRSNQVIRPNLGEIRAVRLEEIVTARRIGPRRALIFLHGVQRNSELTA